MGPLSTKPFWISKDFVSEEILGLKKVESGQKKFLVGNTFWVQEKALSDFVTKLKLDL